MLKATYFTNTENLVFNRQNPIFNKEQIKIIARKTPDSETVEKVDDSGNKYKSVKSGYVKALVAMVTGGNFSFTIKSREFFAASSEVLVEASLTIITEDGATYTREQIGTFRLSKSNNTGKYTDVAKAYISATSSAFKKCASEFGFCWDIYNQERPEAEQKETKPAPTYEEQTKLGRLERFLSNCDNVEAVEATYSQFIDHETETTFTKDVLEKHMTRTLKAKAKPLK